MYHCMTYSEELDMTLVGHCTSVNYYSTTPGNYFPLSGNGVKNVQQDLNTIMCRSDSRCLNDSFSDCDVRNLQRRELMCGSCASGYAPPVYSYNPACVKCNADVHYKYNWLKYIAVAFLPLTVFYIVVVLFRITVTTGAMNGLVLVSQIIASPIMERIINRTTDKPSLLMQIGTSIYGMWNLDFFRDVYTPFCLHPGISTLQTLALDYLVAVYPIVLIVITYFLVKLHDNYRVVVWLWKPFHWCFTRIHNEWEIRSTLLAIFVTFLLLSYVKILNVSFSLLTPNTLYDVNGTKLQTKYLYYDGTYKYFGKDHLPYAFLALFMLLVFNIFPLVLLCLWPCRCFHRCLNFFRLRFTALHIIMDTFHGCYKLNFEEPRIDCRWCAAFFLLLRVFNQILVSITIGPMYFPSAGIFFLIALVIIAICRPYKLSRHVVIDVIHFTILCFLLWGVPAFRFVEQYEPRFTVYFRGLAAIVYAFPPLYTAGLMIYRLIPKKMVPKLKEVIQKCLQRRKAARGEESALVEPYRLQHSDEYAPLVFKS